MKPASFFSFMKKRFVHSRAQISAGIAQKPVSFISFDAEAFPARASEDHE
jgi:hypothetical protein